MRRTKEGMKKLRIKIIKLKEKGLTVEEIRRRTGASPNTICKILKGFKGKYCQKCGETNPEVLEQHHPDKINRPDFTITLCANCHEEITRKQARERNKKKENEKNILNPVNLNLPATIQTQKENITQNLNLPNAPVQTYIHPLSPEETKKGLFFVGGVASILESFDPDRKPLEKFLLFIGGSIFIW
jgi:Fic family protein